MQGVEHRARAHAVAHHDERAATVGARSDTAGRQTFRKARQEPLEWRAVRTQTVGGLQPVPERRHAVGELVRVERPWPSHVDADHLARGPPREARGAHFHLVDRAEHFRNAAHVGVARRGRVMPAVHEDRHERACPGRGAVHRGEHAGELTGTQGVAPIAGFHEEQGAFPPGWCGSALGAAQDDPPLGAGGCDGRARDRLAVHPHFARLVIQIPSDLERERPALRWPHVVRKQSRDDGVGLHR